MQLRSPYTNTHTHPVPQERKKETKKERKGDRERGDQRGRASPPVEGRAPGKQQLAGQPRSATTSSSPPITLQFSATTAPVAPSPGRAEPRKGWLANGDGHGLGAAAPSSPPRPRHAAATTRVCRRHLITVGKHRGREKSEFCKQEERESATGGSHLRLCHRHRELP
ncbi:uncharacterized protein DS421_15g510170 [Arachis hypogaea]|nr:uncharacterized protein DS421_15g510170 [Arachis hypogaea]